MGLIESFFGDVSFDRAKAGQVFTLVDPKDFDGVDNFIRAVEKDGSLSKMVSNVDFEQYRKATVLCLGKGGGGHPQFQIWADDTAQRMRLGINQPELPSIIVSTDFNANGNPIHYGLAKESPDVAKMALSHRKPLDGPNR